MITKELVEQWRDEWFLHPQGTMPEHIANRAAAHGAEAMRERCVKACEELGKQARAAYKGKTIPVDKSRKFNPHTGGMCDGAYLCAVHIEEVLK